MAFKILLVVLAVAVSSVYSFDSQKSTKEIYENWRQRTTKEHPECRKTWGVSEEEQDKYFQNHEIPPTRNAMCFVHCVYKGFNFINKDGTINRAELIKDAEKVSTEMLDFCEAKIVQKTDECERMREFVDCTINYQHVYF